MRVEPNYEKVDSHKRAAANSKDGNYYSQSFNCSDYHHDYHSRSLASCYSRAIANIQIVRYSWLIFAASRHKSSPDRDRRQERPLETLYRSARCNDAYSERTPDDIHHNKYNVRQRPPNVATQ